jgi:hypothetical protein
MVVLSAEPPPAHHPLLGLPNVVLTPRSWPTMSSNSAAVRKALVTPAAAALVFVLALSGPGVHATPTTLATAGLSAAASVGQR